MCFYNRMPRTQHASIFMIARITIRPVKLLVAQISSFIDYQTTSYTIQVINRLKQSGCNDCGLFAITTATALCRIPSSRVPFAGKLEPNIGKKT